MYSFHRLISAIYFHINTSIFGLCRLLSQEHLSCVPFRSLVHPSPPVGLPSLPATLMALSLSGALNLGPWSFHCRFSRAPFLWCRCLRRVSWRCVCLGRRERGWTSRKEGWTLSGSGVWQGERFRLLSFGFWGFGTYFHNNATCFRFFRIQGT